MKTHIAEFKLIKLARFGLTAVTFAAALAIGPVVVHAADSSSASSTHAPAKTKKSASRKSAYVPFHGKVSAVDTGLKTFAINRRTFNITSATKIKNATNNASARFSDIKVGGYVSGSYTKATDGKLNVHSLNIGKKAKKPKDKKKSAGTDSTASK